MGTQEIIAKLHLRSDTFLLRDEWQRLHDTMSSDELPHALGLCVQEHCRRDRRLQR